MEAYRKIDLILGVDLKIVGKLFYKVQTVNVLIVYLYYISIYLKIF
jgi:hypothetical protein